jgi:hypothetical protein
MDNKRQYEKIEDDDYDQEKAIIYSWDEYDVISGTGKRERSKLELPRLAILFTVFLFFISGILFTTKKIAFSPAAKASMTKEVDYSDGGNAAIYVSVKAPTSSATAKISGATSATTATASTSHSFTYAADVDSNEAETTEEQEKNAHDDKKSGNDSESEDEEEGTEDEGNDEVDGSSTAKSKKNKTTKEFGHS